MFNPKNQRMKKFIPAALMALAMTLQAQVYQPAEIEVWTTTPDRSELFRKQEQLVPFSFNQRRGRGA